jgi:hypothetical protein
MSPSKPVGILFMQDAAGKPDGFLTSVNLKRQVSLPETGNRCKNLIPVACPPPQLFKIIT